MAEELAYFTCKVPGCGAKYYIEVDLYHDENNGMFDEEDLKNRCRECALRIENVNYPTQKEGLLMDGDKTK
jgi:hypothetical protein